MIAIPASVRRPIGPSAFAFIAALSAIVVTGSQPAFGGLIFTQVGLDGHVRSNGGSGPVVGVETHFTTEDFPPPNTRALPATNPPLPSPLLASNNLSIMHDFVANAPLNGDTFNRSMLWITSPSTGKVFRNSLDDFLATPVKFDTTVYLQELLPTEQLDIEGIRVEVFGLPPLEPAANTIISNNIGSQADPIQIHLDLAADQLVLGDASVKLFIYYDTTARVIPEPATAVLLCAVVLSAVVMRRRLT